MPTACYSITANYRVNGMVCGVLVHEYRCTNLSLYCVCPVITRQAHPRPPEQAEWAVWCVAWLRSLSTPRTQVPGLTALATSASRSYMHVAGIQYYDSDVKPVPVASITIEDAEMLQRMQDRGA